MLDILIIGAGLSGLTAARQLQDKGYSIALAEKSRGLGGRVATRRLQETCADHGLRALEEQGNRSRHLLQPLSEAGMIERRIAPDYEWQADGTIVPNVQPLPRYVAPLGMTAIAKFLAEGLTIYRSQRVEKLVLQNDRTWEIQLEPANGEPLPSLKARAVLVAIPAPQALMLLEASAIDAGMLTKLRSVKFDACLSAIATYAPEKQADIEQLPWQTIAFPPHSDLAWVSLENAKRSIPFPVFVVQSSAAFAERFLEATDLQEVGRSLLQQASDRLLPWLSEPEVLQVHRWRYARVFHPLPELCLKPSEPLAIVCCGDWCGGKTVESALESGFGAAEAIDQTMRSL